MTPVTQHERPAVTPTAPGQTGSSAVLSAELTAALARYQRTLAQAPLAGASRAKYAARVSYLISTLRVRQAPRNSGNTTHTNVVTATCA